MLCANTPPVFQWKSRNTHTGTLQMDSTVLKGGCIKKPMVSIEKIFRFHTKIYFFLLSLRQHLCSFAAVSGWHGALGAVIGGNVEIEGI